MIGDSLRAVIDLLMLRKTEKKLDLDTRKASLETEKLERERVATQSLIIHPDQITVRDIQTFDPRAKLIRAQIELKDSPGFDIEQLSAKRYLRSVAPSLLVAIVLVLAAVSALVGLYISWLRH